MATIKKYYYQAGYIFSMLVLAFSLLYPFLTKVSPLGKMDTFLIILVIGISFALEMFTMSRHRILLAADQKSYLASISAACSIILNIIIIYTLSSIKLDIVIVRLFALLSVLVKSIILNLYIKSKYKYLSYKKDITDKKYLDKRFDALYLQIFEAIQLGSPIIIITFMLSLKDVSIYAIYNLILLGISSLLSAFSTTTPTFGNIIAKKEYNVLQRITGEFEYIYYDVITIVYSISLVMIMPFIYLYTRSVTDFSYYFPLIGILFVINGLLSSIRTPQQMLVIASGVYKETNYQVTIQTIIMIVLALPLTHYFGIVGVLIASILSNLYRSICLLIFVPKRITKLPVKKTFIKQFKLLFCLIVIILPFLFIKINITNFSIWILSSIIQFIYACLVILVIDSIFYRQQLLNAFRRVKSLFRRVQ
jgi:hypothetical protein